MMELRLSTWSNWTTRRPFSCELRVCAGGMQTAAKAARPSRRGRRPDHQFSVKPGNEAVQSRRIMAFGCYLHKARPPEENLPVRLAAPASH